MLRETLLAGKRNTARAVNWLSREDIRRYNSTKGRKLLQWETYEASMVEGSNYYRLVARNGKLLKKQERDEERKKLEREAARRRMMPGKTRSVGERYSMSIQALLDHHEIKYSGEDVTPDGRKYWIIDTRLHDLAPLPAGPGDMALSGDATLWIDQETKLLLRQELRVTRVWRAWLPGSLVFYEMLWNGEVMLVKRISLTLAGQVSRETDQVYSNYRKFASSSDIRFEPSEIP